MKICDENSIRNNRGGSCRHVKTGLDKPNKPPGGRSKRETCETIYVLKKDWNGLNPSSRNI